MLQELRALASVAGSRSSQRRWVLVVALLAVAVLSGGLPAYGAPGDLDPTFSGDGRQLTDFSASDFGRDVAIQPDGKIVVAGSSGGSDFALARYNADGSLDSSFSGDGKQTTDFDGRIDGGAALAIQPNGRIVVAGSSGPGTGSGSADLDFALARYNGDGSLDSSFSADGKQTTDFGGERDSAADVAIQPDGKIVAAGSGQGVANTDFALARYNADGSLDSSFSGDGRQTSDFEGDRDSRRPDAGGALAIQPDGKIVVAGQAGDDVAGQVGSTFALVRYNADGSLDSSFSGDGSQTTDIGEIDAAATALALQPDGKIVVAGRADVPGGCCFVVDVFALARYHADGALDASFSGDGKQTTDFAGDEEHALAVALQADGRIVAAGATGTGDFGLARYNPAGSLDGSFSGDGKQTTTFGSPVAQGNAIAIQADGKIVVAGTSGNGFEGDFAVARYEGDEPPPTYPRPPLTFPFAGCPASSANLILGSAAGDTRNGTPGADRIFTGAGNDVVDGRAGEDCIDLGAGADRGGGGQGNDLMLGQSGADRLSGSSGRDRIRGGPGKDRITAGSDSDRAFGDAGNDRVVGSSGNDVLQGSSGNDSLSGGRGRDRISGGAGSDVISGGSSSDRISGDRGSDRINANAGKDRINGNSGNDRISARDRRRDRINCGAGRDTVTADHIDRVARSCERVRRI